MGVGSGMNVALSIIMAVQTDLSPDAKVSAVAPPS
jgi:hypothetical protein